MWVEWTYTPAEWTAYLEGEWRRTRRRLTRMMRYFGGAGLGSGVLIAVLGRNVALGLAIGIGSALLFGGTIPGLVLLASYRVHRTSLTGPRVVQVGPNGVQIGRRRIPFAFGGPRSVALQPGAPCYLALELRGKSSPDGPPMLYIAVPPGREAEAEQVIDQFRAGES